ncbi:branched-chain amino acid ABC transporter permease [Nonomuraea harbinensis]|uniref:Branched-chain amino acid ABC transporter permease n=1 Tax=Nonomuraea harbinensis TaxID=1286938 RepID=A0ABW1C0C5_9ACTN|nr:branched-chain amino acid ABC transporter permease [Nonomuraea harbinensis]
MTPLALLSGSPRRVAGVAGAVAAALVLLALPGLVNPYLLFQACLVMVTATAGLGLVLIMGWSGQIALSQAGFLGVGAYATTYLVAQGWAWPLAAVTAGLVAALFGVLIGLPATRLRGFYLAIATLAFAELMIRVFVEATPVTGGIAGTAVQAVVLPGIDVDGSRWYLCLAVAAVTTAVVMRIGRVGLGRRLRVVRDAEIAAPSLGVSPMRTKLLAFALSAFIGGIAGALYAQCLSYLTPEIFDMGLLIEFLVIAFLGGVGYVAGPFLGAVVVVVLRDLLQDLGSWQRLVYGLILALAIAFLPRGLASLPARLRARRPAPPAPEPPPVSGQADLTGAAR